MWRSIGGSAYLEDFEIRAAHRDWPVWAVGLSTVGLLVKQKAIDGSMERADVKSER